MFVLKSPGATLTTLILKDLGVAQVTVKVQDANHMKIVEKLGADEIIQPEQQSGKRLASKIIADNVLDYIDLNDSHSFIVVNATEKIVLVFIDKFKSSLI